MKQIKVVYGPYKQASGRDYVVVHYIDGTKKTTSFARHLYEQTNNVAVGEFLVVDHIDEDFTNNDVDNLQLISSKDNKIKYWNTKGNRSKKIVCCCPECGNYFYKEEHRIKALKKGSKKGPFCSRKCAGKHNQRIGKQIGDCTGPENQRA